MVAQLLVFPIGRAWEKLPRWRVPLGPLTFDVNPGRFSIKEHALIVIVSCASISGTSAQCKGEEHKSSPQCVNLTASVAYANGSLVAIISPVYWNRDFGPGFSFLYLLTTQALGWVTIEGCWWYSTDARFGLAGLSRRWLVYPAALIWPSSLSSTVLFRALHEPQDHSPANGWTITRYKYFGYLTAGAFVLFWFPDYIWTSLGTFAFVTWIAPTNQKVNTIFGVSPPRQEWFPELTDPDELWPRPLAAQHRLDADQLCGLPVDDPILHHLQCVRRRGLLLSVPFAHPLLHKRLAVGVVSIASSSSSSVEVVRANADPSLPLLSSSTFDNTGKVYNISRVIDKHYNFDLAAYKSYSPMYISMSYSLTYGLSFAAVTAIVVHTYLYNGKEIWAKFKNSRSGGEDIHKRLMNEYKEVPDWWYGILTAVVLALGCFTVRYWDTGLPIWGFIVVCFGMGVVLIIPEGILEGTTNQRV